MGASSHIMTPVASNNYECSESLSTLQVELSGVGTSILNFEWVVLPPCNNKEAMPLEATIRTIFFAERSALDSVLHIKVLTVPPYPCKKNTPPFCLYSGHYGFKYCTLFILNSNRKILYWRIMITSLIQI